MNIADIRRQVTSERPDPARIAGMCRRALDDRTDTDGEHAEVLFYLAEASFALDRQSASLYADKAARASTLAIRAGDFLLAVKAACLRIFLLNAAKVVQTSSLLSDLAEILDRLLIEWRPQMDPIEYITAMNVIGSLQWMFTRQAQNAT